MKTQCNSPKNKGQLNSIVALLLAVLLAGISAFAQTATEPTKAPATTAQPDYTWTYAVAVQTKIGTHVVDHRVRYVTGAINNNGDIAFVARFPDSGGNAGVYTTKEALAEEGAVVSGQKIVQIISNYPHAIQINDAGNVGWIAVIQGPACQAAAQCVGAFVNGVLAGYTTTAKVGPYFVLDDMGKILGANTTVWYAPPQSAAGNAQKDGAAKKKSLKDRIKILIPPIRFPCDPIPYGYPYPSRYPDPNRTCTISADTTTGAPSAAPPQARATTAPAPTKLDMAPTPAYCPLTRAFPFPWGDLADGQGPNTTVFRAEGNFNGAEYHSKLHPDIRTWSRSTTYSDDCRPIATSLAIYPGPGASEIYTPGGLVTSFDAAKGSYDFPGVAPVKLPPASQPIEDSIFINRKCSILVVPVTLRVSGAEESGMLLGTLTKTQYCQ